MATLQEKTGFIVLAGYYDAGRQQKLLATLRALLQEAPLFTPRMPKSDRLFSVRMSNCGSLGWVSDKNGYRYAPAHPETGRPWPPLPDALLRLWDGVADYPHPPEACLINFYGAAAKMGLHQDRDEADFAAPVVSLSLGNSCLFRIGGLKRGDRRALSASIPATCWFLVVKRGLPSMASTAFIPVRRPCSRKAAGSI